MLEYHVDTLPQLQYIVDKSGEKGHFRGWLIVRINLGELPVICLGQDEAIFKHYIFTKNMWNHKVKYQIVPNDLAYGIIISAFQYQYFGFGSPLTVLNLQTIKKYSAPHPKYVDIDTATTILGHNQWELNTMGGNYF